MTGTLVHIVWYFIYNYILQYESGDTVKYIGQLSIHIGYVSNMYTSSKVIYKYISSPKNPVINLKSRIKWGKIDLKY